MKHYLNIALLQWDIHWEHPGANMKRMGELLDMVSDDCHLVILPETFSTGFTMEARRHASRQGDKVHQWMETQARERRIYLSGSLIVEDGGKVYNRLYFYGPGGLMGSYDKRHLFRMGREDQHFESGTKRVIFQLGEFRLCPQICYDLRFPVFARNRKDYDLLYYVANWPAPRHRVWEILLRARAIENQAYVLGVSRTGIDGEGVDHLGGSCVINPMGEVEGVLDRQDGILEASLDLKKIREFREKFPVWKDADEFRIQGLDER